MSIAPGHARALLSDRQRRWKAGQRILSEVYFALYPKARQHPDLAVELIHQEYRLLLASGVAPSVNEFLSRFPEFAGALSNRLGVLPERVNGATGPRLIGRFVLRRPLGESERGVCYKAYDKRRRTKVALKLLRVRREEVPPDAMQALRAELPRAASLKHPNLTRLLGLRCGRGESYIVREYVHGMSLADWLLNREKARSIRRAVSLVWKVSQGLAVLHEAGLIHRNVKPSNVLLDSQCEPHLCDLDLLPIHSLGRRPVGSCRRSGHAAYLAPEQTPEYAAPVSPAADVYSLGVVLHQLISGVVPDGNPPLFHRPDLDPVLEQILKMSLARRPQDRLPNGRALAIALGTWLKRRGSW